MLAVQLKRMRCRGCFGPPSAILKQNRLRFQAICIVQDDIWVSRAPGRLDVMGGISDYSGSLVLQMPIAQACHVAAQIHPPGARLKLWQHIRHRHVSVATV
jgi:hypothetical protein